MRYMIFTFLALAASLSGCAKPLTEAGGKIELLTAPHAQGCEVIEIFPVNGSSPDDVLHKVLNRAAELGGDSAAIAGERQAADGDYIDAVALRCLKR